MKTCKNCKQTKEFSFFSKSKKTKDGFQEWCKECTKEYRLQWYSKNKKIRKEYNSNWRQNNKSRKREYDREYLVSWRFTNQEKAASYSAKRRAIKLKATPSWLNEDDWLKIDQIYNLRKQLQEETGIEHHVDHIVPLQGENVCGLHVPWNLQVITAEENTSKSNKLIE